MIKHWNPNIHALGEIMKSYSVECTPVCPFKAFVCHKNALIYRRRGKRIIAFCTWIGDECIGYRCQFAGCSRHALLPDGKCKLKLQKVSPKTERKEISIEEEADIMEKQVYGKIKDKLRKLGVDFERLE